MTALSKRQKEINKLLVPGKLYSLNDALKLLKAILAKCPLKFREGVDLAIRLGVDPRKSDQVVRGSVVLPKGTGKTVRVAVFTSGANVKKAEDAGADLVGMDELAAKVKAGEIDFDILLATPEAMRVVGQLGQILGPRGLMPNPKDGTVTADISNAVKNAKMGQVKYRTDKAGIVHCSIGKIDFEFSDLVENFQTVIAAVKKAKPINSKGTYFKKVTLSTTMGPGLTLDISDIGA